MDLFSFAEKQDNNSSKPLAYRMRPQSIDEMVGQEHILAPGKWFRQALEKDLLLSFILFGPPGTGKTTLAELIAKRTKSIFTPINAVTSGVPEIRKIVQDAKERLHMYQERTILFIDEIHRLNRTQQDALLPHVEDGTVVLIGATTENPSYSVNSALLSRATVVPLQPLNSEHLTLIIERALIDSERGLGVYRARLTDEAMKHLVQISDGDVRRALNALEIAVTTCDAADDGTREITLTQIEQTLGRKMVRYDKQGDQHYDTISAFIKSMRGSDPDATLYYLAKMIHAGEDPRFIARRIMVHAAEDVGLADPNALVVATAAAQAVEKLGMPEGRLPLAEAALYIATAPKSNSVYNGINSALALVEKEDLGQIPLALRDASSKVAKQLGYGKEYKYPHDYPKGYVEQQYLPDQLAGTTFFRFSGYGYEKKLAQYDRWRKNKEEKG